MDRLNRLEEEFLEAVWTAHEQGKRTIAAVLEGAEEDIAPALPGLEERGCVVRERDEVRLTERGEKAARTVVRCHRIAECLMWQGLRAAGQRMERVACAFEHILLPEIVDSICVLLGHPRACPHGKPIPPGTCCDEAWASVEQALVPIPALEPGTAATIACLRPPLPDELHRLLALGLLPGREVTVRQTEPAVLLAVGDADLAIDRETASHVLVWSATRGDASRRRHGRFMRWRSRFRRRGLRPPQR